MKTGRIPYVDINHTLRGLKQQVIDSLDYAYEYFPEFENPEELFNYLKARTNFKNDPRGVERLQSLPTLMKNGGRGDCDCFVIALLAVCWTQPSNFHKINVVLAGRKKVAPVHIYTEIIFNGTSYIMDLTQPSFDSEREYPLTQRLPFVIHSPQEKVFTR